MYRHFRALSPSPSVIAPDQVAVNIITRQTVLSHGHVANLLLFHGLAQCDDTFHFMFPDHPPEVVDGVWEWPLSGNVRSFLSIPLV